MVENILDDFPIWLEPKNMETNESEFVIKIPQGNQEMCESNPTVISEKAPKK